MTTLEKYPEPLLFCGGNVRCDIMHKYTFKTYSTLQALGGNIKQIPKVQNAGISFSKISAKKKSFKKVKNPVGE